MEGLSHSTRRRYLLGLIAVFLLVSPVLGLYAAGYRLSNDFKLIKTGGIHIDVPIAGADFFLDDEYQGSGSLFQKSFFVQNLLPDTYNIRIQRDGFYDWRKNVQVYPTLITSGRAFLTPENPKLVVVSPTLPAETATGTRSSTTLNPVYADVAEQFKPTAVSDAATSTIVYKGATTTVRAFGNIGLWKDSGGLHAWWLGSADRSPYFFCDKGQCTREIIVAEGKSLVRHADFFPDENQLVIIEWPDGIFITELDTRLPQNIHPLYPVAGATFRVIDGDIFVRDGEDIFEVVL